MKKKVRFVGLDVHAETITAAIAEPDGEVRSLGTIADRGASIRKRMKKLGPVDQLRASYEAGPMEWQCRSSSRLGLLNAPGRDRHDADRSALRRRS